MQSNPEIYHKILINIKLLLDQSFVKSYSRQASVHYVCESFTNFLAKVDLL